MYRRRVARMRLCKSTEPAAREAFKSLLRLMLFGVSPLFFFNYAIKKYFECNVALGSIERYIFLVWSDHVKILLK